MNYYFLISSLPLLQLGAKPPMTPEAFLSLCGEHLAARELDVLRDLLATGGSHSGHSFAREWRERETELRNAVVRHRARHLRRAPDPWLRPEGAVRVFIQNGVAEAFQAPHPLERERALDQLRWRILEELAGLDPFAVEVLYSYALRLRLAWRWASFNQESGAALLDKAADVAGEAAAGSSEHLNTQKAMA